MDGKNVIRSNEQIGITKRGGGRREKKRKRERRERERKEKRQR
jgi:hypothetical protein